MDKQRFALNSADAIEISYYLERLEIRLQAPNTVIAHYFKILGERSEKYTSSET